MLQVNAQKRLSIAEILRKLQIKRTPYHCQQTQKRSGPLVDSQSKCAASGANQFERLAESEARKNL